MLRFYTCSHRNDEVIFIINCDFLSLLHYRNANPTKNVFFCGYCSKASKLTILAYFFKNIILTLQHE